MSEKVNQAERPILTDMSYDEFLTVIDNYVERSSRQSAEMSASTGMPRHASMAPRLTFFELLFENAKQRVEETIPLTGRIVNGELAFTLPPDREATIQTYNNQIVVGNKLLVINLETQQ